MSEEYETTGWMEYDARAVGSHFGILIADAIAERDHRIGTLEREVSDLRHDLEISEREGELLRKRIEELSPSILYDQEGIE